MSNKRDPIEYLINAMQHAAQSPEPFKEGYAGKRQAVLDAITRLRAEVDVLRAAFQPIDADTGWAVICPEVGGIVYSTLDKECTPAFARDLCMEHIKNAMQEPELRSTARRWTVRRIWIARAALSQEAKP